ncbi:MAG: glucose-6-phosphate dehydrogenase, partial [Candidatus Harrisonbacteria bacterium]|nr:glucose-6-phosphate dehydrogenase [Candidatus Harrisonbacteria bacterium]
MDASKNIPTILVVFGATGDLMEKKILPALFDRFTRKQLPERFRVIGFSRRPLTHEAFQARVRDIVATHPVSRAHRGQLGAFAERCSYEQGGFATLSDYAALARHLKAADDAWGVCTNKLFYLAVPPQYYRGIFENLAASGLTIPCSHEEGWTRVIVEKPFGHDAATARELELLLGKLFKEEQIYRIDHYLGKEMVQNILAFRFSNNLLEHGWNHENIERINIRLKESIGVEHRGSFYDGVGALRDVGENHLLQMLAFVTMDDPGAFTADAIRRKRAEVLAKLKAYAPQEAARAGMRAQYVGYRTIPGVRPDSATETYFRLTALLETPRWQGVPILLESGKRLGAPLKEIEVVFRQQHNRIVFRIEPEESITIHFWAKKPGLAMQTEERTFNYLFREVSARTQYTEEYGKLLLDCIAGDQTLFRSGGEIAASWRFTDPFTKAWGENRAPLLAYAPDTAAMRDAAAETEGAPLARKKELAMIGLGKMGANLGRHLLEQGWRVVGFDPDVHIAQTLKKEGFMIAPTLQDAVAGLASPRIVWLMVPAFASAKGGS